MVGAGPVPQKDGGGTVSGEKSLVFYRVTSSGRRLSPTGPPTSLGRGFCPKKKKEGPRLVSSRTPSRRWCLSEVLRRVRSTDFCLGRRVSSVPLWTLVPFLADTGAPDVPGRVTTTEDHEAPDTDGGRFDRDRRLSPVEGSHTSTGTTHGQRGDTRAQGRHTGTGATPTGSGGVRLWEGRGQSRRGGSVVQRPAPRGH